MYKTIKRDRTQIIVEVRKWLSVLIMLTFICSFPPGAYAQLSEYDVKAVFLSRIAEYIEWPEQADAEEDSEPFVIAVIGENPFGIFRL